MLVLFTKFENVKKNNKRNKKKKNQFSKETSRSPFNKAESFQGIAISIPC